MRSALRRFRRGSTLVVMALVWTGLAAPAEAGKLRVRKMPQEWSEMRSAPGDESGRVERIRRVPTLRASLPEEAQHGHLTLGPRLPSLFERRDLEKRRSFQRGGADTTIIKVAVIRVEFETDRAGDRTTGDGRFLRENPDPERIFIDPAPHDAEYFAAHLEAVNRYWQAMTYGCVRIEGDVFPLDEPFGAYRLTDMADYGPTSPDEFFSIEGLTNYSRESLIAADADSQLVWDDYDVYFVVHAGSDWQNDVLQNTPLDLPTFSISFADSQVVVTDEGDTLRTMITYPETASQDGFNVGLNGGIAHEMGHQLGLFDIYNVETFAPTVAFYDVMDSGNLTSAFVQNPANPTDPEDLVEIIGVLPSAVGAWSRWLVTFRLGIDPFEVKADVPRARLRAIQDQNPVLPPGQQKWYRLSISNTEYFLVENRVDDLDGRDPEGFINTALDQDDSTGVILGPINATTDAISYNYDFLIDPGVLIWHVDERQALANLTSGRGLNVLFDRRSVAIEEADGIVDIGSPFSFFPLGTDKEAFHADNNANFTPDTRPNSDSNLGSPSGIAIRNIGPRGLTVSMDLEFGSKPAGWPVEIGEYGTSGLTSTTMADVDGDGLPEIAAAADSAMFVLEYDDGDGDGEVDPAGAWPQPAPGARTFGTAEFTQTLGDLDGDGRMEVIVATDSGAVHVWTDAGVPFGAADSVGVLAQLPAEDRPTWSPVPADLDRDGAAELYLVTRDGRLHGWDVSSGSVVELFSPRPLLGDLADSVDVLVSTLAFGDLNGDSRLDGLVSYVHQDSVHIQRFDRAGTRTLRIGHPLPEGTEAERVFVGLADLDRDAAANDLEILLATDSGWITVLDSDARQMPGWPVQVIAPVAGPPAFGDLDGDGLLEIALTSGGRDVHALNYNGTEMPGWPVLAELADYPGGGTPLPGPAIADVDGDGRLDVLVGLVDFTVQALDPKGRQVPGFPLVTGAAVRSTPCVLDANGDGLLDLFIQSTDGQVYARRLAGRVSAENPAWPMFGGGPALHGAFPSSRLPVAASDAGGMLRGPVTVFPNPVRSSQDEITVRYTLAGQLPGATEVRVRMYNLAGEQIREVVGTAFPNTENVVRVPTTSLASGVYFCSVRARSGSQVETQLDKFAVIR